MGANYAAGLAEAVEDGLTNLRPAIAAHLAGNFYPPLPLDYVEPVVEAIDRAIDEDFDRMIRLPGDINPVPRTAEAVDELLGGWEIRAGELLEITKCWAFVPTD
jgi:hypothetical protein